MSATAGRDRRRQLGFIRLAASIEQPLVRLTYSGPPPVEFPFVECFPVAPIAYRVLSDGAPNVLGRKYEHLMEANAALEAKLPPRHTRERTRAELDVDTSEVVTAIHDIVGIPRSRELHTVDTARGDTVLGLLFRAIATLDEDVDVLARSALLCLKIGTEL